MFRFRLLCTVLVVLALPIPVVTAAGKEASAAITIDKEKRTVTIDCKIAPRKINDERYKEIYPIEVIGCWPFPKGQKAHETVVVFDAKPSEIHKAMEEFGLKPGTPVASGFTEPKGPEVNIYLEVPGADGRLRRVPIEKTLLQRDSGKPLPKLKWRFTGSAMTKPDPNKDEMVYGADMSGTLISIFPVTDQTVFQTNLTLKEEKYLKLETDKKLLPKEGDPVKLIIEVPHAK